MFLKIFRKFSERKKNKKVIYRLRVDPCSEKTVTSVTIRTSQPAHNIYLLYELAISCILIGSRTVWQNAYSAHGLYTRNFGPVSQVLIFREFS